MRRPAVVFCLLLVPGLAALGGCSRPAPTVVGSGSLSASPAGTESAAAGQSPAPSGPAAAGSPGDAASPPPAGSDGGGVPAPGGAGANQPGGSAPQPGGPSYTNPTFGFTVRFPTGWTKGATRADGRGSDFTGPNGATASVYGSNNLTGSGVDDTCSTYVEAFKADGGSGSTKVDGNRCWASGEVAGSGRQIVSWVGAGAVNTIDVTYPPNSAAAVSAALGEAAPAFTPGDLSRSH